jgi:hypothetical protein
VVPEAVDPTRVIEERLKAAASEHEPRIAALDQAIAAASRSEARGLRAERRRAKRAYRNARREVEKMRGPAISW